MIPRIGSGWKPQVIGRMGERLQGGECMRRTGRNSAQGGYVAAGDLFSA